MLTLLILAAACHTGAHTPTDPPATSDPPAAPLTEADAALPIATVPDPAAWSVRVDPPAPRWDQDLRCVVDGLPADTAVTITWTVNSVPFTASADGVRPGDTIPHLSQAGGQAWGCGATAGAEVRTSTSVQIEPPFPMALVPPGSFKFSAYEQDWDVHDLVTITRPYWIASYETTHAQFQDWMGYQADEYWDGRPNTPVIRLESWEPQITANTWSVRDGLPECYVCEQLTPDRMRCVEIDNLPACPGYRLPTAAEWEFASTSGGMHSDPLPAGGIWAWFSSAEVGDTADYSYDPPAVGPNAPPNTLVSGQCWFFNGFNRDYQDVGQLIPNALGLFDMCGNASEVVSDSRTLNPAWEGRGLVDPHSRPGSTFSIGGAVSGLPTGAWSRTSLSSTSTIRLVRTNLPIAAPGGQP